ncbi:YceI family protein [Flavobacterium sp.]|uniref:YceI family protein n=1 Tax=Flavobacterium sp. TaxID=239 RepID=UPI0026268449|nr:YceI family protein [Flavobacterium sp.]
MKKIFLFLAIIVSSTLFAQDKIVTKNGSLSFEASVPSFEEVKAKNDGVTFIINTKTGEIASLALVKGFRFKVALMEEHFNENYVESDKFPKSTFKGKIENFDFSKLTTEGKTYTIKGTIELHGKSKEITITATLKKVANGVDLNSSFYVNTDDFDIKIPSVVSKKVSKKVNVKIDATLK